MCEAPFYIRHFCQLWYHQFTLFLKVGTLQNSFENTLKWSFVEQDKHKWGQYSGYMPLILALQRQRQKRRWDNFCEFETSLKEMHNKFQVSHSYTVLSYLNKQTNKYYRIIIYNKRRTAKIVNSYYDSVFDVSQKYPIIAVKGKPVTLREFQKG